MEEKRRINQQIRAPQIMVIDDEGNKLGQMTPQQALVMAEERGLDVVEVAAYNRIVYGQMAFGGHGMCRECVYGGAQLWLSRVGRGRCIYWLPSRHMACLHLPQTIPTDKGSRR